MPFVLDSKFTLIHREIKKNVCLSSSRHAKFLIGRCVNPFFSLTLQTQKKHGFKLQMKRILIVIDSLYGGGAERVVSRIANALSVDNEVIIYARSTPDKYPIAENIKVVNFTDPPNLYPSYKRGARYMTRINRYYRYYRLIKLCASLKREVKPDVTLSMLQVPNLMNAFSKGPGRKVLSERNNPSQKDSEYRIMGKLSYRKADRVVFQTETIRSLFSASIRKKGVVIPNPVSVECKATDGSKRIVTMGRMHPQKNHALLIKAFAEFSRTHPEHTLHIYGKDRGEENVQPLIDSLSLTDKVIVEGFKDPIHPEIADAEQFVLSSDYEGTPNALLEAMMMGLPCITTAFEGARELLGDDAPCMVTPLGDERALVEAMVRLADNATLRETLSERGKEFAQAFTLEKIMPKWRDVLLN